MSTSGMSRRSVDDDVLVLIFIGLLAIGGVLAAAVAVWDWLVAWLIAHQILIPAGNDPILEIPAASGAGLDGPRLSLLAGVLLGLAAIMLSAVGQVLWVRRLR
jgi:hypothetical protein